MFFSLLIFAEFVLFSDCFDSGSFHTVHGWRFFFFNSHSSLLHPFIFCSLFVSVWETYYKRRSIHFTSHIIYIFHIDFFFTIRYISLNFDFSKQKKIKFLLFLFHAHIHTFHQVLLNVCVTGWSKQSMNFCVSPFYWRKRWKKNCSVFSFHF